ncbi:hypothetical protein INT47_010337 [Mucor saturninus]|uniref:Uncharacterized protein n=1 Tax=Mucor saturninus TaxID=64648 RepID=A0A8H7QIX3_9FUNG|nr:hypothetical protein INT47_010337 [Mucor saturninus]
MTEIVEKFHDLSSNVIVEISIVHINRFNYLLPAIDGYQLAMTLESIKNYLPKVVFVDKPLLRSDNKSHVDLEIGKKSALPPFSNNVNMESTGNQNVVEDQENYMNISASAFAQILFGNDIEDVDEANFEYGFN